MLQVVTKLHRLLKPFMLRRMKADVEICLPRKQEILLYAPMTEEQQKINKQLLDKTLGVSVGGCVPFFGGRELSVGHAFEGSHKLNMQPLVGLGWGVRAVDDVGSGPAHVCGGV